MPIALKRICRKTIPIFRFDGIRTQSCWHVDLQRAQQIFAVSNILLSSIFSFLVFGRSFVRSRLFFPHIQKYPPPITFHLPPSSTLFHTTFPHFPTSRGNNENVSQTICQKKKNKNKKLKSELDSKQDVLKYILSVLLKQLTQIGMVSGFHDPVKSYFLNVTHYRKICTMSQVDNGIVNNIPSIVTDDHKVHF